MVGFRGPFFFLRVLNVISTFCNYCPQLMVVRATDENDQRASFSNWGNCVEMFAPGVNVESADYSNNAGAVFMSGTSMACPHVTGGCSSVIQVGNWSRPANETIPHISAFTAFT